MATMTVGKITIDLEKLSVSSVDALETYESDGVMTDAVIVALSEWNAVNGGTTGTSSVTGESTASKIRRMAAAGMKTGDIARALDIRFQFAYNVLNRTSKTA